MSLETLIEVCERTGWKIHAGVLMGNHYHWLLETPEDNLVEGMKRFQPGICNRTKEVFGVVLDLRG